ncbi:hypothetical protein GCK32_011268 [Trichostrongylus colubriformis]|uniref:Uncharacterized protein n=1 Tax=Trichostrongylus colubriformis TaxID=6319 RepID=A0AAN8IDE7_TRICO
MITIDGSRSFMKVLIDGRRKVTNGTILITFPLNGLSLPAAPLGNLKVTTGVHTQGRYFISFTERNRT